MAYLLYGEYGSGAACVEAALAEAGAPYERRTVSLAKDEQRSAAYRAINPSGKVPALTLPSGEIVTETSALLILLAERHPEAKLLPPPSAPGRAQALRWIAFLAAEVYPIVEFVDYPERLLEGEAAGAALRQRAQARMHERMLAAEGAVAGPWFLPYGFSALDIYAAMFSRWREFRLDGWREAHIPKIVALAEAVSQRPKIAPVWRKHFPNG